MKLPAEPERVPSKSALNLDFSSPRGVSLPQGLSFYSVKYYSWERCLMLDVRILWQPRWLQRTFLDCYWADLFLLFLFDIFHMYGVSRRLSSVNLF